MEQLDMIELYKVYRSYEEHENHLINQRTTWLVDMQSGLVPTFGFSFQKYYEISERITENHDKELIEKAMTSLGNRYQIFLLILCVIGAVSGVAAYRSIRAATDAQKALRSAWNKVERVRPCPELPPLAGGGQTHAEYYGATFSHWLTIFFFLLWIAIALGVAFQYAIEFKFVKL